MTIDKFELRFNENVELSSTDEGLTVSGYVNKTNQWSQTLGQRKKFRERILPGAFQKALQMENEIDLLAEHDKSKVLASTKNGSLQLREDQEGLYIEAKIIPTEWGKSYHALISEGIITNMSFGMQVLNDSWNKLADGTYERSISDLNLFEVSAVRNPAYVQSSIAARSIEVVKDVEPVEQQKEKRALTLTEDIDLKKSQLSGYEKLAKWGDEEAATKVEILTGEIRKMENQIKTEATVNVQEHEKQENRATSTVMSGTAMLTTDLIREKVKKVSGKHSLVARTNIIVQEGGRLDVLLEDGENYKQNLFVGEMQNVNLEDFTAQKVTLKTERVGSAIEVSELLLEKSVREDQEKSNENKLIGRIEDSMNYSMLTTEGNMDNLNADTAVSSVIGTKEAEKISLVDTLTLISKLNQEYRDGASFIMHTDVFNQILTNVEYKDHLEFAVDEVTGKKLYHLLGYPVVVNDNANPKRIIFGHLYEGFKTLISLGPKPYKGKDIYGNETRIDKRSFVLQKTTNTEKALKGAVVHVMDAFVAGKVVNKDCFVRLDVTAVTPASESQSEEVENPVETVSVDVQSVEPEAQTEVKEEPKQKPKRKTNKA